MFSAAVARPRFNTTRNSYFDGKLSIFPFTTMVPTHGSSCNRPTGTMVIKPMAVTKEVYCDFICSKGILAIKDKWPLCHPSVAIKMQHNHAKPHLIPTDDPQLEAAIASTGMNISLVNQPPNSPKTNVLDLGYFNAIQSLQHKKHTNTIPELVKAVEDSFKELDKQTLNKVFLTRQQCLEQKSSFVMVATTTSSLIWQKRGC
jgi:hypothetical protein